MLLAVGGIKKVPWKTLTAKEIDRTLNEPKKYEGVKIILIPNLK
jgi:hypothetical protein